jgi:hypothetical protein
MSVGRDKGKRKMTLSEIEAQKEREQRERRAFHLQEAKERIFPEERKRKALEKESESEGGESEEDPGNEKVPCDGCCERKPACEWGGTGWIKVCHRCHQFHKLSGDNPFSASSDSGLISGLISCSYPGGSPSSSELRSASASMLKFRSWNCLGSEVSRLVRGIKVQGCQGSDRW